MKECKGCHETLKLDMFTPQEGYYVAYCKSCRSLRQRNYYSRYRMDRKLKAIAYLGGKCRRCGYNKSPYALDFNHINPEDKEYEPTHLIQKRKWNLVISELNKCELLCANCHRELTAKSYVTT